MSGEADGIILLPLLALAIPYVGPVLLGTAVVMGTASAVNIAVDAARDTRRAKRKSSTGVSFASGTASAYSMRDEVADSGLNSSIGNFRNSLARNMKEQKRLNKAVSDDMKAQMEQSRQEILKIANSNDPEKYQKYMTQVRASREELTGKLVDMQEKYVQNYHTKINESMETVTKEVNQKYAGYMEELKNLQQKEQEKEQKAAKIAATYIEEAKALVTSFEEEFEGEKYSKLALADLRKTLNDAIQLQNSGRFEAAIATAKDVSLSAIEEIYKADCKNNEWENYYQLAVGLAAEVEGFISAQGTITEEVKSEVEKRTGKTLEEEVVGIQVSDYTAKTSDGTTLYEKLLQQTRKMKELLLSEEGEKLSLEELKGYVNLLNNEIYPKAQLAIYKGILNMSNAFSRQNLSEEIIDFFEEHNFEFAGYNYDNDAHDGALHIGLLNDVTGEEIIVTLAPELMSNGEVQTKVEIDQLQGDETNEARKEYYRQSVRDVVVKNTPGAQISLQCKSETKNKLSQKTEMREKLQS